jgi:SAM-dependent methyltransferase
MLKLVATRVNSWGVLVLDMGCGDGRNALALAKVGHYVIAADIDVARLRTLRSKPPGLRRNVSCVAVNFLKQNWPFSPECFDLVIAVHFPDYRALINVHRYMKKGALLYFDSVGAQGQNYLQLPQMGWVRSVLSEHFVFEHYKERPAGPIEKSAVAVRLLARRL